MSRALWTSLLILVAGSLTGCITSQTFVDPQYHKAGYESLQRISQPVPVKVDVEFQRNGQPLPAADNELRGHVERTLRATGVLLPAADSGQATIKVIGNNIADLGAAKAAGFKTGLTFGGAGSVVADNYEFTCTYKGAAQEKSFSYQHALHTTIGNAKGPAGLAPTTPADGFARVVEDVILNFVKDLQDSGVLPKQ